MTAEREPDADALRRWNDYLSLLVRVQVDPRLRSKLDLSGIVQQTLLEASQRPLPRSADDPRQEAGWLRKILATNLADELRKLGTAKREMRREVSLDAALEASSAKIEAWLAAEQSSPSQRAERNEQALQLAEGLAALPETQREALILQHWHGWTVAQIAEHLGKTRLAVAGLLKRGLQALREFLGAAKR